MKNIFFFVLLMFNTKFTSLVWRDLQVSPKELRLDTLRCGQSFRWKHVQENWVSVLQGNLVVLKESGK
jgi:N-glycosylase/DNA lyase